ncbi:MAG: glycerophosphodiester phosphodiesterase family protein [Pseudomonadota bacterium]
MSLRHRLEVASQQMLDMFFAIVPRPRPELCVLKNCKIVSHRGEHDNRRILENTFEAFDCVEQAGVWGIEFDVRWTKDIQPLVIHDSSTGRVFGENLKIEHHTAQQIRQQIPLIPTLQEVVERYAGKMHLMVELKPDELGQVELKSRRLQEIFKSCRAGVDYHFIALQLELFDVVQFVGDSACVPVAELNIKSFSQETLQRPFAGLSGQYLLLHQRMLKFHQARHQKIGTGFAASRFCFYRELNRGVDWIFTNHALKLRAIQQQLLRDG